MSPGNGRGRPGKGDPKTPTTKSTTSVPRRGTDTEAHRRVFCSADVYRRRRFARDLDELLADLYPPTPVRSSTFGLDEDALRRHAIQLHAAGWYITEIMTVLDVELVASR